MCFRKQFGLQNIISWLFYYSNNLSIKLKNKKRPQSCFISFDRSTFIVHLDILEASSHEINTQVSSTFSDLIVMDALLLFVSYIVRS